MLCLKCGRQTNDEQLFCSQCRALMEAYPVRQDARVQLPNRRSVAEEKKAARRRRVISAEERIVILRSRQRRMLAVILVLALLLCATGFMLVRGMFQTGEVEWGKNYTFVKNLN